MSTFLLFLSNAFLIWDMVLTIRVHTHPSYTVIVRRFDEEAPGLGVALFFTLLMNANVLVWILLPVWWRDWLPAGVVVLAAIQVFQRTRTLRRINASL